MKIKALKCLKCGTLVSFAVNGNSEEKFCDCGECRLECVEDYYYKHILCRDLDSFEIIEIEVKEN